ncbi:MAG TPA: EAL domain-containing protein [Acidimicrobiales bacterium]|nr:EAL domain-containing protein [Acidimicrobiales bacterium]
MGPGARCKVIVSDVLIVHFCLRPGTRCRHSSSSRSFGDRRASSPASSASHEVIVEAVIDLGRHLMVEVLAKGVESRPVWELLARMGCSQAQGFYLSRPVPPEQLDAALGLRAVSRRP